MPAKKKIHKPSKNEGGAFGPSAKETKQTKGNRAVSIAAQQRETWQKKKAKKKPTQWQNYPKGTKKNPSVPSAHTKKHNL
jgi:hypothetical protein